ncbi:hypothetical protein Q5425_44470 [Amycolatopsis sp. A133]|uniref:hypothetical protein n=1 Tax=Amycolatopsis sp. A133 TaxID=3064472 RepID=UPI0027E794EF|nr:hypothetical protein [Amycolatopsis sp. A133]MDQ7810822.1 hypothetical protein [Amycolatopsis sp. A133]
MPEPTTSEPLPAELRALAADAEALANRTAEVAARLKTAPDGNLQRLARPIAKATHDLSEYTEEVSRTAENLARVRVARDPGLCDVPWGICPAHGVTLRAGEDRAWCSVPGCAGEWDYDRLHTPCGERAVAVVTDEDGAAGKMCAAHARDAGDRLAGCTVSSLDHRAANG